MSLMLFVLGTVQDYLLSTRLTFFIKPVSVYFIRQNLKARKIPTDIFKIECVLSDRFQRKSDPT